MRHRTPERLILALGLIALTGLVALGTSPARASEPLGSVANECVNSDANNPCLTAADCVGNDRALICVEHTQGDPQSRRCEIPCETGTGVDVTVRPSACAVGETCIEGHATPNRKGFFCKASAFRVDLNLLDQCVAFHLGGFQPVFSDNQCSLEANLTRLLDQNGDSRFDIFDLDLCIVAFLEQPGCDPETSSCAAADLVFCADDKACGRGLYCDPERHACQRDCGLVASREDGVSELERRCTGNGKACDFDRGRCVAIDVTKSTCDVDSDCVAGAYCFLGRCSPKCYRSADCPSGGWYCTENNRCRALALPDDEDDGFTFDPQNYAIRFGRDQMKLDAVQITEQSAMVILDLITKKVVVGNPSVSFGYRLELSYALKQDTKCLQAFVDCGDVNQRPDNETEAQCRARQDDCYVDDTEQWVTLVSPFGTVAAQGNTDIGIQLDTAAADRLSPGVYTATLRAIFDNGDSDTIPVTFTKASPSGEYAGQITVYKGTVDNTLNGAKPLAFGMRMKVYGETPKQWNTLLSEYHLAPTPAVADANGFVDITSGLLVHGQMHGKSAFAFTKGGATSVADNEIPFVGLYSPQLGRLRIIGIIDIAANFCITESGASCTEAGATDLQVKNVFGRPIRRLIEFIGPFDEATARFHGIYREKISGLVADYDLTLEGGFIMDQLIADDSPIALTTNSLATGYAATRFPTDATVTAQIDADIATYCVDKTGASATDKATAAYAKAQFADRTKFDAYIQAARRIGAATTYSALGRDTIFPQLRQFKDSITEALAGLGTSTPQDQQDHLSIYDFLSSFVLPCTDASASPPPMCVDENAVRCGLALHRKALVSGWVNTAAVSGAVTNPTTGELDMFCPDTLVLSGCPALGSTYPALFAMQEHNRFWSDLGQILKFDADKARSDAFLVLYRNEINPFIAGAARSYKMDKLRAAVRQYDALVNEIVGPDAAKVLFTWPGRAFKSTGNDWLEIMHTIVSDRMDAIAELVDLERRVAKNTGATDFIFADHMMQNEYLIQVYLLELQSHWQKELFAYRGEAVAIFEKGQNVLNQLNPAKNSLGVTPERVYFENGKTSFYNWQNYRDRLVSTLIPEGKELVTSAVDNLKNAIADLDAFESSLHEGRKKLTQTLNDICGDPTPGDPSNKTENYCQQLLKKFASMDDFARARDCKFKSYLEKLGKDEKGFLGDHKLPTDCPANFEFDAKLECLDEASTFDPDAANGCKEIIMTLYSASEGLDGTTTTTDLIGNAPTCALTSTLPTIDVNGVARPCVGGQMAALLQEKALVDRQRRIVVGSTETVLKRIQNFYITDERVGAQDDLLRERILAFGISSSILGLIKTALEQGTEITKTLAEAPECLIVAGVAAGTDCPGNFIKVSSQAVLLNVLLLIETVLQATIDGIAIAKEVDEHDHDDNVGRMEAAGQLVEMIREIDPLIAELNVLTQTSFNLSTQIEDLRFQASDVVRLYNEDVTFVAEHLVGRESGNYLLGQAQVRASSEKFRAIVQHLSRMAVAFIHHYNVAPGDAATLIAQAESAVTMDDVDEFVAVLDKRALEYCGMHGLDCDFDTNTETLRVSLRDTLFPNLRDIVDAHTGQVLTAGQQFHNLITRPPFLKRRIRANMPADQIEIPFSVSATPLANTKSGEAEWLIDPLSCNQLIDGRDPTDPTSIDLPDASASMSGSIAVNFIGQNIDDPTKVVRYQLVRGPTDFVRGCDAESVVEEFGTLPVLTYPIRKHIIGYAPQSVEGGKETPASYVSVSQPFTACVNNGEALGSLDGAYCWRYFARDRSLASPDWKLVIPINIGGARTDTAWIADTGLSADTAPIIDDVVIYFRYRSRPVQEN